MSWRLLSCIRHLYWHCSWVALGIVGIVASIDLGSIHSQCMNCRLVWLNQWHHSVSSKLISWHSRIPWPGIEPGPRRWKRRILATRPSGIHDIGRRRHRIYQTVITLYQIWLVLLNYWHCYGIYATKIILGQHRFPWPGIEPGPRRWERRILATRPSGTCLNKKCYLLSITVYKM